MDLFSTQLEEPTQGGCIGAASVADIPGHHTENCAELLSRVQTIIRDRSRRATHFSSELFGEPAWDILLELYAAELSQQRVPTSQVTVQASIPATTVLRWLKVLDAAGHIVRRPDPLDARRVYLSLTPKASGAMTSYFANGSNLCPT
jgi:DNA-binding MarR family transcriptional regulator